MKLEDFRKRNIVYGIMLPFSFPKLPNVSYFSLLIMSISSAFSIDNLLSFLMWSMRWSSCEEFLSIVFSEIMTFCIFNTYY